MNIMYSERSKKISRDISIEGLKTSVMLLETELSVLENKRADLYRRLNEFRVRHNATVGMLLGEILRLRLEQFRAQRDKNPDTFDLVDEAEDDLNRYKENFRETHDEEVKKLSKAKDKELQLKYREASKLCHPDLVNEEQKAAATSVFADLNNAYYYNNLERVKAILTMLKKNKHGFVGRSDNLSDREMLEFYESRLKVDVGKLRDEIKTIKESAPWRTLKDIDDWDEYFANLKRKMEEEREELKRLLEIKNIGKEDTDER